MAAFARDRADGAIHAMTLMERPHLTMRSSEPPPAVRPHFT